jgi:hypothetical protein
MNRNDLLRHPNISEAFEVIGEWIVLIGLQKVKIRVMKNINGGYNYETSHFYNGPGQMGAYPLPPVNCSTVEDSLKRAVHQLTTYYDPTHIGNFWVANKDY